MSNVDSWEELYACNGDLKLIVGKCNAINSTINRTLSNKTGKGTLFKLYKFLSV
jgi:hypothetical protein